LNEIQWLHPPRANVAASVRLPDWTNFTSDWPAQLAPSLQLQGGFSIGRVSYRGFEVDSAQSRLACSNQTWESSALHLVRPEGEAVMDFTTGGETNGFALSLDSRLDPANFRPLLPAGWIQSLLLDGAWKGISSVLVFLPQILLLFLFIGFLEDTGYMARAAFLMDRLMSKVGLPGKSFIPMQRNSKSSWVRRRGRKCGSGR